jgi:hypothetical protein
MAKVDNKRKGIIGVDGFSIPPGIHQIPKALLSHWYLAAFVDTEQLTIVDDSDDKAVEEGPLPNSGVKEPNYALDDAGNRIQATDDAGEFLFDDESGEPLYLLAEE